MRFMMIVRATKESEAGVLPKQKDIEAMMKYNEELVKAGVLLDAGGLQPSSAGALIDFTGGKPTVKDGPYAETKELIAGYWIIQVRSKAEAIEWAKRVPHGDGDCPIEVRQMFEVPELTDDAELLRKEEDLRALVEKQKQ